jgi:SAM-dependent methyltransferase
MTDATTAVLTALAEAHPDHFMRKFYTTPLRWEGEAQTNCELFGIGFAPPVLRILDIGCGFGFFLAACRLRGHETFGLDIPDPVIQEAAAVVCGCCVPHVLRPDNLLPTELKRLDVVTMMGVNLRHEGEWWGWQEYTHLAGDILQRLNPDGRWIIFPNRGLDTDWVLDSAEWRTQLGARWHVSRYGSFLEIRQCL